MRADAVFPFARWRALRWRGELLRRLAWFLVTAVGFFFIRSGVPVGEALRRGVYASLAAFLVERFLAFVADSRGGPRSRFLRGFLIVPAVGFVLAAIPVIVAVHPLRTVPSRSPVALGLATEDVVFRASDGVRLSGWFVPCEGARGTVVYCHGWGRNRGQCVGLLRPLHEAGFNVLAFDFRGHGSSSGGAVCTFGPREVSDVRAACAVAEDRSPGTPVVLVGVSLGASVILQALPELPNVRGAWCEAAFGRLDRVEEHCFAIVPPVLRRPWLAAVDALAWLDAGVWAAAVNPVEAIAAVSVPVFLCQGQQDEMIPPSEGRALLAARGGSGDYWWVEGATHYNVHQRHREEYEQRLCGFLEECLRRREAQTQGRPSLGFAP